MGECGRYLFLLSFVLDFASTHLKLFPNYLITASLSLLQPRPPTTKAVLPGTARPKSPPKWALIAAILFSMTGLLADAPAWWPEGCCKAALQWGPDLDLPSASSLGATVRATTCSPNSPTTAPGNFSKRQCNHTMPRGARVAANADLAWSPFSCELDHCSSSCL